MQKLVARVIAQQGWETDEGVRTSHEEMDVVVWREREYSQRPMLRLLLDAGADPGLKDAEGRDALDHAALGGPTGLDRLLIGKAAGGGQPRCDLDLSRSPGVRGLRLGLTLREVTTRFRPPAVPEAEWCGRLSLEFDWADDLLGQRAPRPPELEGVRRIRLGFLDGRLAYFRVTYDPREAPPKPEQFRAALSSSLSLPGRWRRAGAEGLLGRETLAGALTLHLPGILHAHEGQYEEAAGAFLRAIEAEPEMAGSYVELGLVYGRRGDYARMVAALRQAVGIGPGGVRAYLGERPLGDISTGPSPGMSGHGYPPARAGLEHGLSVVAAAISHLAGGRDDEAARVLERESVRESGGAPATVMLALSYLLRGECVEADDNGVRRVPAPSATGE